MTIFKIYSSYDAFDQQTVTLRSPYNHFYDLQLRLTMFLVHLKAIGILRWFLTHYFPISNTQIYIQVFQYETKVTVYCIVCLFVC